MGFVYHGSNQQGLKELQPHQSTHGKYLYATPRKELAYIFAGRSGDDLTHSIYRNSKQEPWNIVERIPRGFEHDFRNTASIYTFDDQTFQDFHTGFCEVMSSVPAAVIFEEYVPNVYQRLEMLEKEGKVKLYHYPDRPEEIPADDQDLVEKCLHYAEISNCPIDHPLFTKLLYLHPHLLSQVNITAKQKNPAFQELTLSDLEIILKKIGEQAKQSPDREWYLDIAEQRFRDLLSVPKTHQKGK